MWLLVLVRAALGFCDDERPSWSAIQVDVGIGKSGPTGVQPSLGVDDECAVGIVLP